jgi:hypothetical protein
MNSYTGRNDDRRAAMSAAESSEGDSEALATLNRVFVRALLALGDAGEADQACRLAAAAWSALRHRFPREADRLNGVMHSLTQRRPT